MSFSVPTFKLASGKEMPTIAWGNYDPEDPNKVARELGPVAVDAGFVHIDTAQGYNNQEGTADFLKKHDPDHKLFLTTKLSTPDGSPDKGPVPYGEIRPKILETIKILGRQPNVLIVHNPFVAESIAELWKILDKMIDDGELTADLGISNYRPQDFKEMLRAAKHKPVVHQLEVHPYVLSHIQEVIDLASANNILTTAYAPLAPLSSHPTGGPAKPVLEKIAARLSKETGKDVDTQQALLLWFRAKQIMPVTGSHTPERMRRQADVQGLPDIAKEEVDEVDKAGLQVYSRKYPEHYKHDYPAPNLPEDI